MLLNREGFTYTSSLDLNMGYYNIELSTGDIQIYKSVLSWGKEEYEEYLWGYVTVPIFSKKRYLNYLMGSTWYMRT